ncbi:hypothetical protein Lac2_04570 [Claveliimonas bilis]|uniref:O-antigen ligase family protein n=1 Tax=Claveliimonas bilis TaxID=3028070 RepID=UPI00292CACD9|nr:O-antigen ligase family protein [Claveliimonas bilis]BDZ82323.1 hypothetical protein Lac2_04570 [Claveliimonas bilis]
MKISLNKTIFSLFYILIFVSAIGRIQYSATSVSYWIALYRTSIYLIELIGVGYTLYKHVLLFKRNIAAFLGFMVLYELAITFLRYRSLGTTLFNEIVIDLLGWPLVFIFTYQFVKDIGILKAFKGITVCGVSIIIIITAFNISNMGRIGINPAVGGVGYCVAVLPLVYLYFPKKFQKIITFIVLVIVLLSTKRSSFLALLIGIFTYYISDAIIQKTPRQKINKMLFVMFMAIVAAIAGIYMLESSQLEIVKEFTSQDETLSGRTLLWERILTNYNSLSFSERFFGSGMHAVKWKFNPYGLGWYAHNSFIETLYDYGIVGMALLIIFIVMIIKKTIKMNLDKSRISPIISFTIPPMLLFASSSYFFEIGQIMIFYSFIWSFCVAVFDIGLIEQKIESGDVR